jgi:hypothetical protein
MNHQLTNIRAKERTIDSSPIFHLLHDSVKKIIDADIEQLKIYLGLAYFVFVSILSIFLFL